MSGAAPVPSGIRHALMGRDAERARLAELTRGAAGGRGALVLIEAGIGKTALLRAALDGAARVCARRVTGAAEEFDQRLPFATLHAWLEPLAASDQRVAQILALIAGGNAEYPVIESVLALVEDWCSASPVALAVDDLHWADPASILLLHRLGRVAGELPLLLAGTIRSGASRDDVDALVRSWCSHGAAQIVLGPLPDPAVTQLVAELAGGEPGPVLRGLIDGAAGNPLYINELVGALAREMRLHAAGAHVDIKPSPDRREVPPTLRLAVMARLEFLSAGRYAAQRSAPGLRRSARHARAQADQDGDAVAAVAEDYAAADRALFAAQAREQAAPLLAAAGRVSQARDALLSAVAGYETMEASWDLARTYTLLRTLGIRRGVRGPRRRPRADWDALTEAETVVAGLVAEGLSNPAIAARLYLSRRTVQFHVSSVLAKLGIASRVELAAIVIRHHAALD